MGRRLRLMNAAFAAPPPDFLESNQMPHKTYSAKPKDIKREWHIVDVSDKILGRAASQIATILKGKHKPMYTPSIDTGDHVVVINAAKIKVTGNKEEQKMYYRQP